MDEMIHDHDDRPTPRTWVDVAHTAVEWIGLLLLLLLLTQCVTGSVW